MMKYIGRNRFAPSLQRAISQSAERPISLFHSFKKRTHTTEDKEEFPQLKPV